MEKKEFDIRSEEVQDILSFVPSWMIRWGTTLVAIIFIVILLFCWLIKYPNSVVGEFTLSTSNPSVEVYSEFGGRIKSIHASEGSFVKKGDKIIIIENVLESEDVEYLINFLMHVKENMSCDGNNFIHLNSNLSLGEIQKDYNQLLLNLEDYHSLCQNEYYKEEESAIRKKIENHIRLVESTKNKVGISKEALEIGREKFLIHSHLFQSKIISKMENLENKEAFIIYKRNYEDMNAMLIDREIILESLYDQLKRHLFDQEELKRRFIDNIENGVRVLENHLDVWSRSNILKAPFDGTLVFLKPLPPSNRVLSNEPLFVVIPESKQYIGYVKIDQKGIGKIKIGDKILIRFHNYPYKEFGQVEGVVKYIPDMAFNNSFNLTVGLTNGMRTSYQKNIAYSPEMKGDAEVITEDIRLLQRFVYHIYSAVDN